MNKYGSSIELPEPKKMQGSITRDVPRRFTVRRFV